MTLKSIRYNLMPAYVEMALADHAAQQLIFMIQDRNRFYYRRRYLALKFAFRVNNTQSYWKEMIRQELKKTAQNWVSSV